MSDTITLATELTVAWLSNPNTRASAEDVPAVLALMYDSVGKLGQAAGEDVNASEQESEHVPAVSVRKSLASREHIISMIDGKPYRSLARHLKSHGLTPEKYRSRYNLKADYPMVAPSYSEARRETALRLGLGRKPGTKTNAASEKAAAPAPAKPTRSHKRRAADAEN